MKPAQGRFSRRAREEARRDPRNGGFYLALMAGTVCPLRGGTVW